MFTIAHGGHLPSLTPLRSIPGSRDQIVDVLSVSLLIRCIVLPFLISAAGLGTE
jgi:hypothetical protein